MLPALLGARATSRLAFRLQFLLAFLQGLKAKLPAMKLDTELVDVTGNFRALRFVLFELMLQIGNPGGVFRGGFESRIRNGGRFAALLAIQRHPSRGGIDYERSRTMSARENDVAARFLGRKCRAASLLHRTIYEAGDIPEGRRIFGDISTRDRG